MALDLLLRRFLIHSGGIQLTTAAPATTAARAAVGRHGRRLSGLHFGESGFDEYYYV